MSIRTETRISIKPRILSNIGIRLLKNPLNYFMSIKAFNSVFFWMSFSVDSNSMSRLLVQIMENNVFTAVVLCSAWHQLSSVCSPPMPLSRRHTRTEFCGPNWQQNTIRITQKCFQNNKNVFLSMKLIENTWILAEIGDKVDARLLSG